MTFEQLVYLEAAARCQSFTLAARELFVSQSTISMAVKELERELGIVLFTRGKKGVVLTEQGAYVLERVRRILQFKEDIEQYGKAAYAKEKRIVHLETARLFALAVLPDVLTQLMEEAPDLTLLPGEAANADIIRDVSDRKTDMGIIAYRDSSEEKIFGEVERRGLHLEWLASFPFECFMSDRHKLAGGSEVRLSDLRGFPVVLHEISGTGLKSLLEGEGIEFLTLPSYGGMTRLLSSGQFVAVLPRLFAVALDGDHAVIRRSQVFYDDAVSFALLMPAADDEMHAQVCQTVRSVVNDHLGF